MRASSAKPADLTGYESMKSWADFWGGLARDPLGVCKGRVFTRDTEAQRNKKAGLDGGVAPTGLGFDGGFPRAYARG